MLDDDGSGSEADLIQAIEYIQQLNDYGRHIVVHGTNISVGLFSDPTWYACGQTPLCTEINRLVKSGVAVVVAAGNTGYGEDVQMNNQFAQAGQPLSINDPGECGSGDYGWLNAPLIAAYLRHLLFLFERPDE